MSAEQRAALGDVEIVQINKTIQSAQELKTEIEDCDIIAVVAPIGLQEQFLRLAGDKPVITAVNDRRIIKNDDGSEDKVDFHFVKWKSTLSSEPSSFLIILRSLTAVITGLSPANRRNCSCNPIGATTAIMSQSSISVFNSCADCIVLLICTISTSPNAALCSADISCRLQPQNFNLLHNKFLAFFFLI